MAVVGFHGVRIPTNGPILTICSWHQVQTLRSQDRPRLPQRAGSDPPCPWPLSHEPSSPPSRWAPGFPCGLSIPPHPKDCVNGCGHPMEAGIAQRACGCGPALMAVRLFSDNSS